MPCLPPDYTFIHVFFSHVCVFFPVCFFLSLYLSLYVLFVSTVRPKRVAVTSRHAAASWKTARWIFLIFFSYLYFCVFCVIIFISPIFCFICIFFALVLCMMFGLLLLSLSYFFACVFCHHFSPIFCFMCFFLHYFCLCFVLLLFSVALILRVWFYMFFFHFLWVVLRSFLTWVEVILLLLKCYWFLNVFFLTLFLRVSIHMLMFTLFFIFLPPFTFWY